jgi:hypothetical protein
MDGRQLKMLGGTLIIAGGMLLGVSVFLKWWGVCVDAGEFGEICGYATGLEDWRGMISLIAALAVLVLGILGLVLGGRTARAIGLAASCCAAAGLLMAILSFVGPDTVIGTEGARLTIGPFVAGIAAGIAIGGGIVLSRSPSAQATPEQPPPPPVPAGGFTA